MLRAMVKKENQLSEAETLHLIQSENYAVLSVHGEDGFPYGVPVNYLYQDGRFILHGTNGPSHKMDALARDNKVCLTIVAEHELIREDYTTRYASVIVFGTATILQRSEEKKAAMVSLVKGLAPSALQKVNEHCVKDSDGYAIIVVTPCQITGKASR